MEGAGSPVPDVVGDMLNDSLEEMETTVAAVSSKLLPAVVDVGSLNLEEEKSFTYTTKSTLDTTTANITAGSSTLSTSLPTDAISTNTTGALANSNSIKSDTSDLLPTSKQLKPQVKITPCFGKKKTKTTTVTNTNNDVNDTSPKSVISTTPTTSQTTLAETTPTNKLQTTPTVTLNALPITVVPSFIKVSDRKDDKKSNEKKKVKKTKKDDKKQEKIENKLKEKEKKLKAKQEEKEKKLKAKQEEKERKLKEKKEEIEKAKEMKRFLLEEKKLDQKIKRRQNNKKTKQKCSLTVETESIIITSPVATNETTPIVELTTPIHETTPTQLENTVNNVIPTQSKNSTPIVSPATPPKDVSGGSQDTPTHSEGLLTTPLTPPSRNNGLWVQCDDPNCHKWRYLKDYTDPSSVPDKWYCSMNKDTRYNTCDVNEEVWSDLNDNEEYVYSSYTPGSVVLAKLEGFPWWPGLIEEDPDFKCYYEIEEDSTTPDEYHVVFFDTPVTRGWISSLNISPFTSSTTIKDCGNHIPPKSLSSLSTAVSQAQQALDCSLTERLSRWGFSNRYGNRKRKSTITKGSKEGKIKRRKKSDGTSYDDNRENIPIN